MKSSYQGFKHKGGASASETPVDVQDLTPEQFWNKYISPRKPVLIQGHLPDADWHATSRWNDAYLVQKMGSCKINVEVRDDTSDSFGQGRKKVMTFHDFMSHVQKGNDKLYLTTQPVPTAGDGHPGLWCDMVSQVRQDFPAQPSLIGNLVPQQINIWMGCTQDGSSSGLHHDFHDNLYVLLRGRKRFRLWDPSHAAKMHTHGKIAKVHANGRIVYEGQGDVCADGSSAKEAAAWAARTAAEERVAAAEKAVAKGAKGAAQQLAKAEAALDTLLEEQLAAALGGGDDDEDNDVMDLHDDYEDDDDIDMDDLSDDDDGDDDDDEDDGLDGFIAGGRRGLGQAARRQKDSKNNKKPKDDKSNKTKDKKQSKGDLVEDNEDPPSFCTGVDLSLSDTQLRKKFPGFPGKAAMMEIWVEAGQMLYLPAGWFHEVTSYNTSEGLHTHTSASANATCHLALNYWFHPPDNLDSSKEGFAKPYTSDYWPALWRQRQPSLQRGPHPALVKRDSFDGVKVDELDGSTGQDPHRGPRHSFDGVKVDELEGGTGHDPHRGPDHHFQHVKVDEKDGATGHDPHRGPRHSFDGVKVDELDGGTGHDPHPGDHRADGTAAHAPAAAETGQGQHDGKVSSRKSSRKGAPKKFGSADHPATAPETTVPADAHQAAHHNKRPAEDAAADDRSNKQQAVDAAGATGSKKRKQENNNKGASATASQKDDENMDNVDDGGDGDGVLMPGEDGDLGEMVAKEMHEYFASTEGAGAFRLALGKYLMDAMAREQEEAARKRRVPALRRGRRHHRPAKLPTATKQ